MSFSKVLEKYRKISFNQRDKGERFERLMCAYLQTDPKYAFKFKKVWLWNDFAGRADLGGTDTGIDLVALTVEGDYWAIQCKCYQSTTTIDKPSVDSFLSTSSRTFLGEDLKTTRFAQRLWISTTNLWGPNAEEAIRNQHPPVTRLNLTELEQAPVDWQKLDSGISGEHARLSDRQILPHQKVALEKVHDHFKKQSRGRLIMACGTGKTFTALRISENETKGKGFILFLVPSIALLGQTLREWTTYSEEPINAVCICSDSEITKTRTKNIDIDTYSVVDLALPASTNVKEIVNQFHRINGKKKTGMTVVFSTYQSIEVIAKAQKELKKQYPAYDQFDLIICDEAHRTTGVSLADEDESAFTKVHDNNFINAKKRLYMTATPRLYSDDIKSKAAQADAILCSMDDVKLYGEEVYRIGFGEAVDRNLLTDYKVLILTLSENDVPPAVQKMIADKESEINTDDASKLIGCINALSKQILGDEGIIKDNDPEPMRRAVAFCSSIAVSKKVKATFNSATEAYVNSLPQEKKPQMVNVCADHIDGTMAAPKRDELLGWLKAEGEDNECRILTNVRCLSEGVDVPSLDAVLFLSARNSQVDVVQSVGRVMRKSPGKKYGYIIIPVVVPADVEADKALDDNERYKVVWTVLNAIRAHDDRFNATVNKIELNKYRPSSILVGRPDYTFDENGRPTLAHEDESSKYSKELSKQMALQFEQLQHVVFARMVQKVGDRRYWEQWAKSVAEIAERQVTRINGLIKDKGKHEKAFEKFLIGLQKNINPAITQQEAVEMLSQHIITRPVFDALFEGYSFVKNNAISVSMQSMLDLLESQAVEKDTETLQKFYESVRMRASGIDNAEGKQRIIIELYDKFFKTAFPRMVEKLGIVYTPLEVVDFIIHSVNDILKQEFNRSISEENVHILDPFTGTGTFITRLLQSGLISKQDLKRKYKKELHANEIVLLAYYIAAVNIENSFHDVIGEKDYTAFDGICLTDTFQLGEADGSDKMFSEMFPQNSERVANQKKAPIKVIIGNPPYSVGQKDANDNAQNQKYFKLEKRIADTYVKESDGMARSLYDAYIKAFRWSSDRLDKTGGIISFVSNGSWIDSNSASGFRRCIEKEFSSIYVFNLRGNQRTSGELSRKEGGKIFGSGSRTPIAITLLIKNPTEKKAKASIYYKDIGDYLSREEKLEIIKLFGSVGNSLMNWQTIKPNEHADWISQRNDNFSQYIPIGSKNEDIDKCFFKPIYSRGIGTSRDIWSYCFSKKQLAFQMGEMIEFYNKEVRSFQSKKKKRPDIKPDGNISTDKSKIGWSSDLKKYLEKGFTFEFNKKCIVEASYRPFNKMKLYFDSNFIYEYTFVGSKMFPDKSLENLVICIPAPGGNKGLSLLITNNIPDLHLIGDSQCFPLYYYENKQQHSQTLFDSYDDSEYIRRDGISDYIFDKAKLIYGKNIKKEDIFYYVYGFLHSKEYSTAFSDDLKKSLPRIPLVDDVRDFWAFSKAGKKLAELHLSYENVPAFKGVKISGKESGYYKVEKMRFPNKNQKDTIVFNSKITISNIPSKAYEYIVNGKSAIEWIIERYQIPSKNESGIINDPNDWAKESGNPRYILDLLLSIINVSVETVDIVNSLPKMNFETVDSPIDGSTEKFQVKTTGKLITE